MARSWINRLLAALYGMVIGWFVGLIKLICDYRKQSLHRGKLRDEGHRYTRCQVIPPDVYKRPDPLIYCQSYLMSLGLAVTWDNPDIQLYELGSGGSLTPASSNDLKEDTDYEAWATIYNASNEAAAIGMPVDFSYLSFGIGTVSTAIGTTSVDLPVRGAPGHPATAKMLWHTPKAKGHYCLQVRLIWADDANPNNNLGQENTNVGTAHSPALFEFPVRNDNIVAEAIRLLVDAYVLPRPLDCNEITKEQFPLRQRAWETLNQDQRKDAIAQWCGRLARRHAAENFPVPKGWDVTLEPREFELPGGETRMVRASITPPDGFTGTQAININAVNANGQPLGGVTLYVQR